MMRNRVSCSEVSHPSATAFNPRACVRSIIADTISASFDAPSASCPSPAMNERSIFKRSTGKCLR